MARKEHALYSVPRLNTALCVLALPVYNAALFSVDAGKNVGEADSSSDRLWAVCQFVALSEDHQGCGHYAVPGLSYQAPSRMSLDIMQC